jgi:hypothetical protein
LVSYRHPARTGQICHRNERASLGLITGEEFTALEGTRELRNIIVHGGLRSSSSPSSAVEMVAVIHDAISDIYARAARA